MPSLKVNFQVRWWNPLEEYIEDKAWYAVFAEAFLVFVCLCSEIYCRIYTNKLPLIFAIVENKCSCSKHSDWFCISLLNKSLYILEITFAYIFVYILLLLSVIVSQINVSQLRGRGELWIFILWVYLIFMVVLNK